MLRATPISIAAGSRLCMPSRYAVIVPVDAQAADEPGGDAADENAPDSSLNPQPSRSEP